MKNIYLKIEIISVLLNPTNAMVLIFLAVERSNKDPLWKCFFFYLHYYYLRKFQKCGRIFYFIYLFIETIRQVLPNVLQQTPNPNVPLNGVTHHLTGT